ncbi:putative Transcriptional regulator, LysR family [uncultured delta proteobacterium]|uniref:Putative Transcriptional regulator, LysR family n=1 Tax=uncultured delta proteobacterium TaxID=34034 RepID=A0A212JAI2_9DELT|nr:putative Transcriptional regulator, LysR family [uncultured delta proteobacterium]
MRLEDVRTFLRIVATKTLGQAADDLHLTPSSVSKRLLRLEEEVGAKLVERRKGVRTVTLTRAGAAFVTIANRWLEIQEDVQALQAVSEHLPLAVGSLESQNIAFFSRLYAELLQHRPLLRLKIMQRHSDEMYSLVDKRVIHVGFSLLDQYNPNVTVRPCYREPLVGLRPIAAPAARGGEGIVRAADLDPRQELHMEWSNSLRVWHSQHWDPAAPGGVRVDSLNVIRDLLQKPGQWTIFPYSLAKACLSRGNLEIFRIAPAPPERVCYALTHKFPTEETVAALEIFNEILMRLLREELPPDSTIYENPILG